MATTRPSRTWATAAAVPSSSRSTRWRPGSTSTATTGGFGAAVASPFGPVGTGRRHLVGRRAGVARPLDAGAGVGGSSRPRRSSASTTASTCSATGPYRRSCRRDTGLDLHLAHRSWGWPPGPTVPVRGRRRPRVRCGSLDRGQDLGVLDLAGVDESLGRTEHGGQGHGGLQPGVVLLAADPHEIGRDVELEVLHAGGEGQVEQLGQLGADLAGLGVDRVAPDQDQAQVVGRSTRPRLGHPAGRRAVRLRHSQAYRQFDVIRYEYYRDREVGFVGFTAKNYLFREEFTSRTWATRYDFPAFEDGRVKRDQIPDATLSGAQGWFINTRLEKFKDRRLREALIDAFDFEYTNKNIMYGAYQRTVSLFPNSPLMATGKPDAAELALLEPFRGKVPDEVFGEPYVPPVSDGSGHDLRLLRRAAQLLAEAGYPIVNGRRVLPNGQPITIEFLDDEPGLQPHHLPFIKNLGTLGIEASLRLVDPVQYRKRVDDFDFDITVDRLSFSSTPGDSLRTYLSSQAASLKGSQNHAGIADPAIDAMIGHIIAAKTRDELTIACRALDRVFRSGRYWIPHWYLPAHRIAYWDTFSWPTTRPRYFRGIPETWWYDRDKAAKLEQKG